MPRTDPLLERCCYSALSRPLRGADLYFIVKSKQLSEFLEALSDERLPAKAKLRTLTDVWRNRQRPFT